MDFGMLVPDLIVVQQVFFDTKVITSFNDSHITQTCVPGTADR